VGSGYIPGMGLPSGGPSLYAVAPWETGGLPANGSFCSAVELLRYSSEDPSLNHNINFHWGQYAEGGAWMTNGSQAAVVLSYRRIQGDWWYGFVTGILNSEYNIPEPDFGDHGLGVTRWRTGLLFYNPADLAAVAHGIKESHEPLPYTGYDLSRFSLVDGGGAVSGGFTFDPANGYLYFIDMNGDPGYDWGYGLIHVWQLAAPETLTLDIQANGEDGPIQISPDTPLSVTVSLRPGEYAGCLADWWIAVHTPFDPPGDWYTYVYPTGWLPDVNLCTQTPLFPFSGFEVLEMVLPAGSYTCYFALDEPDGVPGGPMMILDEVVVNVE